MEIFKAVFILYAVFMNRESKSGLVKAEEISKCECGVFKFPTADKTTEIPLVSKAPQFNFECSADGKASCSNMCVALAGASREEGPKKICELIGNSDTPFVPVIYYKACEDDVWTYTGLKPTLEVCCQNREVIPCA